jgi:hypothetical protein
VAYSIAHFHQCHLIDGNYEAAPRCNSRISSFRHAHSRHIPRPTTSDPSSRHFIRAHTTSHLEFAYSHPIGTNESIQSLPIANPLLSNNIQRPSSARPSSTSSSARLYILFLALYTLCIGIFLAGITVYLGFVVCYYDFTPANEVWYLAKRGVIVNE